MEQNFSAISKSNFYPAFFLLDKEKRKDLSVIYGFARIIDDIADDKSLLKKEKITFLNLWKNRIENIFTEKSQDYFLQCLCEVIKKYSLDKNLFIELIDGISMDVNEVSYKTFEDLKKYIYKVAVIPGVLTLNVLEYEASNKYLLAENLGTAVQLTNIIRDVYEDAADNRFYIPVEDLKKFNVNEDFLKKKEISSNFYAMMNFEYERTCHFYEESMKLFTPENKKILKVPFAMLMIYFELLNKIKGRNFDTRKKIPKISKLTKLKIIFKLYF